MCEAPPETNKITFIKTNTSTYAQISMSDFDVHGYVHPGNVYIFIYLFIHCQI
jgi:hypothetical protein